MRKQSNDPSGECGPVAESRLDVLTGGAPLGAVSTMSTARGSAWSRMRALPFRHRHGFAEGLRMSVTALSVLSIAAATAAPEQATGPAGAGGIRITRSGEQASRSGAPQYFTGSVRIDALFDAKDPSRASGPTSPSSPVPARRGTHIPSVRP